MKTSMRRCALAAAVIASILLGGCGNAQSRKAGYVKHGQQYFATGNLDKARVEYRNALQIDPKDASVRFELGQIAEKMGDAREAVAQYQAAVGLDPKDAAARAALGRLYLYGGLPDKAVELVEPGLAADPKNAKLLTVRGAARAQLGDDKAAFEDAQSALQAAPTDDYAVALVASLYKKRGEYDEAIETVQSGLARMPNNVDLRQILADLELTQQHPVDAEAQLRAVIALQPNVLANRYRLARFYIQQKNLDAAEKTLREAVAEVPGSDDAKLQLVTYIAAQQGIDRASSQVDQFTAAAPDNDKLKLVLGEFLAQNGKPERGEAAFRAVIAHAGAAPDGLAARDRLAAMLLSKNDFSGASALIDEVLKTNARDNDALILRANASLARGETQAAINDLRAVLRDQPNAVAVMRTLAGAYERNGEPDQAEQTLRTAVQVQPKDPPTRLALAEVLLGAGKLDQAGALLEQLAKDSPNNLAVEQSLFRVQSAQKHYAEALVTAETIEHLTPKQGMGFYLAGLVEEAEDKTDRARKDYEQSLQREPDAGEPLVALVRLEVRLKQVPAALARVDAAIAHAPDNRVARNLKADVLLSQGQLDAAIKAYQDTIEVAPTWFQGYHGLALAQSLAKRNDEAIKTLQLGIDKTQGASSLIAELATFYERLGRPDDAIALYDGVLAKSPQSTLAANNLAMLLVTYRSDTASLARAQKLAEQLDASSEVSLIDTRGWVKFKSGDFHGAESLLQQAVDKAPAAPEMRYHLAMAQLRSGEQQAAEQNLESAVNANRPFAGIDDAKAKLAQLKKAAPVG